MRNQLNQIRSQFPLLNREVHGVPITYLDNAATSLTPQRVINRLTQYYQNEHSNVHRGIHTLSQQATDAYENTRDLVQALLNAKSRNEIIFTYGTTDSINLLAASWGSKLKSGDVVLITEMEHHANIVPWQEITRKTGAELRYVPLTAEGDLNLDEMSRQLKTGRVRLLSTVHLSNTLGTVNPVQEMIRMAHENGALVMLDAAQSVPHMPIDVQELECDFLVFSAHKMCGPTGLGVLFGKEEHLQNMPPYRTGGSMIETVEMGKSTYQAAPFRFETGTPPISSGIAFSESIHLFEEIGWESIQAMEKEIFSYAHEILSSIKGVKIMGSPSDRAAVLPFLIEGVHSMDAGMILDKKGIAVRTGHHCTQPVMKHFQISSTIRVSLMFYNTKEEIDRLAHAIEETKSFFA